MLIAIASFLTSICLAQTPNTNSTSNSIVAAVSFNCTFNPVSLEAHSSLVGVACPKELYFNTETVTLNVFYNSKQTSKRAKEATLNVVLGNTSIIHPPNLFSIPNITFSQDETQEIQIVRVEIDTKKFTIPDSLNTNSSFVAHIQMLLFDAAPGAPVPGINTLEFMNLIIEPANLLNDKGMPINPPSEIPSSTNSTASATTPPSPTVITFDPKSSQYKSNAVHLHSAMVGPVFGTLATIFSLL